eukprot:1491211-Pleurochrysis_carterae.AAC.1
MDCFEGRPSFVLSGMPISLEKLWSKLEDRFPRSHHTAPATENNSNNTQKSSGVGDLHRNQHQAPLPQQQAPLPLHNSVTGINHPPAARQHAVAQMRPRTA